MSGKATEIEDRHYNQEQRKKEGSGAHEELHKKFGEIRREGRSRLDSEEWISNYALKYVKYIGFVFMEYVV